MPVPFGKKVEISRVLGELAERNRGPISAMVNITWRCNFHCRHCYQACRTGKELSARRWERVFDALASAGVLLLTLSGGEPLVRKDFFRIARAARERRFSLKLKTNAWLLDRRAVDFLAGTGFEQVQVSFYSIRPKVHDFVTGVKGSHERLMSALRLLRAGGIDVHLSMPVMSVNARDIPAMVDYALEEGFEYAVDPSLTICDDGSCSPARLRAGAADLVRIFRDPRLMSSSAFRRSARLRRRKPGETVCNVGKSSVVIDPSGEVRPCAMIPVTIGDITRRGLREIWETSAFLRFLGGVTWRDLHGCSQCDLRPWCVRCHGCALVEDGDLLGPSRIACDVARARKTAVERDG
jgi:radical SAM protein with 4Fe4S-binding SPASM domain